MFYVVIEFPDVSDAQKVRNVLPPRRPPPPPPRVRYSQRRDSTRLALIFKLITIFSVFPSPKAVIVINMNIELERAEETRHASLFAIKSFAIFNWNCNQLMELARGATNLLLFALHFKSDFFLFFFAWRRTRTRNVQRTKRFRNEFFSMSSASRIIHFAAVKVEVFTFAGPFTTMH